MVQRGGGSPITEEVSFTWSDATTINLAVKVTDKSGVTQISATGKRGR